MYVCICRAITSDQVTKAICEGARCVKDINASIGKPIQCGKCCAFMKEIVTETLASLQEPLLTAS